MMIDTLTAIGLVLALLALAAVVVQLIAALVLSRFRRRAARGLGWAPPVTVLVPPSGHDAGRTLAALARQDYPCAVRVVVGVHGGGHDDERALRAACPDTEVEVVSVPRGDRGAQLDALMRRATGAAVAVAEAGMILPPDWLSRMVAPLQSRSIGLVACASRAVAADRSLRARTAALTANTRILPAIILSPRDASRRGRGLARDALAMRRDDLERLGGFRALLDVGAVPAEEVRERLGLRMCLAPTLPESMAQDFPSPQPSLGMLFWHPLPLALAVIPILPDIGLALTAAALLSRWLVALVAGARHLSLLPLRDLLALVPFVHLAGRSSTMPPPAVQAE